MVGVEEWQDVDVEEDEGTMFFEAEAVEHEQGEEEEDSEVMVVVGVQGEVLEGMTMAKWLTDSQHMTCTTLFYLPFIQSGKLVSIYE